MKAMNTMKTMNILAAAATLAAAPLAAVTVGPEWCVAYPVGVPDDLGQTLKIAAEEVADDINEATGLSLKAVPASEAKAPAIWIGAEAAKKAGLDLSGMKWYDNAIAEKGGSIYLFGNDMPSSYVDPASAGRCTCVVPSMKAATRFLESYAGVRFLMPGEVGKEVMKRKAVTVPDGTLSKEHPSMFYGSGSGLINRGMMFLVANGIWGRGPFFTYGGHSYPTACPAAKYYKDHPEYFALLNGSRYLNPKPGYQALCISNPEVEQLMVDELKRRFDMGADVCQLAQQDSWGKCDCENCRAMFGTGDDWDEKLWCFHRKIAERMLKERPGKVVSILSYHRTIKPPKTFKVFPPNVRIEMCRYDEEAFRQWKEYTVPQGFSVYMYLTGNYIQPGFVARHSFAYMAMLAKRFRDNKVVGLSRCGGIGDLWGTEGPAYYVFNRLLVDGSLNVKELVVDYCKAAFGPAAGAMLRFYETQDKRTRMFDKLSEQFPSDSAAGLDEYVYARPKNSLDLHGFMFPPDTVAQMEEALSQAEKMRNKLTGKQKIRLRLVRIEFDYAKSMGAISALYSAYKLRPSKESLAPLMAALKERNAMIKRIFGVGRGPKCIKGWPEVVPFGRKTTREMMKVNGRITAIITTPLTWPEEFPDGELPGVGVKSADAVRVSAPPTFGDFAGKDGWNILRGKALEPVPMKARFKAMYDDASLYLLVEGDLADADAPKGSYTVKTVWGDDYIEVMVAPGATRDVHYDLQYGAYSSDRFDAVTGLATSPLDPLFGKPDATWEGKGWKVESRREGGKWLAIATLPYSDFGAAAPKRGDSWFINVGRVARTGEKRIERIEMLWSPNTEDRKSLMIPNAMGKLTFK